MSRTTKDLLKERQVAINELRAIGGGARSDLWLQVKADVTGIPLVALKVTEAACWGAVLLAGVGAGCFSSAAQAAERTVRLERRIEPDVERMKRDQTRYEIYRDIYPAVNPINLRL